MSGDQPIYRPTKLLIFNFMFSNSFERTLIPFRAVHPAAGSVGCAAKCMGWLLWAARGHLTRTLPFCSNLVG